MMEEFRNVLLDVWREACRHIEIGQSTETIAGMLARHVPIAQVLVRQIDPARSLLETVAAGPALAEPRLGDGRTECSVGAFRAAAGLVPAGRLPMAGAATRCRSILPPAVVGDVLAGPLQLPGGRCGAGAAGAAGQ